MKRLRFGRLKLLVQKAAKGYADDNCGQLAAAISYYVLFAIVPLLIFLAAVFGLLMRNTDLQEEVIDRVADAVPLDDVEGRDFVTDTVRGVTAASAPLGVVGVLGAGWSASVMFGAVRKALNIVWDTDVRRPLVQQKLLDLGMVAGLGLLLGLSVAGTAALRTLRSLSDDALGPVSESTNILWDIVPFVLPAFVSFVVFLLIYRFVPNVQNRIGDVWPGALFAAVAFEVLKNVFAVYVANFRSYDAVYGVLGGVLLFLTFTYLTSSILLLGGELAAEYPRVMRGAYDAEQALEPADERSLRTKAFDFVRGLFVRGARKPAEAPRRGDVPR
jgi:membrane protein